MFFTFYRLFIRFYIVAHLPVGCKALGLIAMNRHLRDTFSLHSLSFGKRMCYNKYAYLILQTESECQMKLKRIAMIAAYDLAASFLLGVSIVVFAVRANFAPGGVSGLAVIVNYLTGAQIGLMTVLINIPIILFTFRRLGPAFFLHSVKTMLINAFFIDYVVCHIPAYAGSRMIAAVFSGVCAGIAYSLVFNMGSSTGGTDFIIAAIRRAKPGLSLGMLAFVIDSTVILASVFVFGEVRAFIYGAVYTVVTSLSLDATTAVLKRLGAQTV